MALLQSTNINHNKTKVLARFPVAVTRFKDLAPTLNMGDLMNMNMSSGYHLLL